MIQCKERNPFLTADLCFLPGVCLWFVAPNYLADEKSNCSRSNNSRDYAKGICDSQQEPCISGERKERFPE